LIFALYLFEEITLLIELLKDSKNGFFLS